MFNNLNTGYIQNSYTIYAANLPSDRGSNMSSMPNSSRLKFALHTPETFQTNSPAIILEGRPRISKPSPKKTASSVDKIARECITCGATTTVQWRNSPNGSLCNRCGLKLKRRKENEKRVGQFLQSRYQMRYVLKLQDSEFIYQNFEKTICDLNTLSPSTKVVIPISNYPDRSLIPDDAEVMTSGVPISNELIPSLNFSEDTQVILPISYFSDRGYIPENATLIDRS